MSIIAELKRRNVFRVAIAYLAVAWLLTEVSGTLFPAFGIPDWSFRFVVILLALGFVPALVFSWAYEITPEGLKLEKDVVREESITHLTGRHLDTLTICVVIAALMVVGMDRLWLSGWRYDSPAAVNMEAEQTEKVDTGLSQQPNSIVVLPLVNLSANPDDAYFVHGIHDDLTNHLSQIASLKTISHTSAMSYEGSDLSAPEIARELGVGAILEGGVQRVGDQVRINVQLIDARTDTPIWAESYDRQLTATNIFAIQSEIAGAVAGALRIRLSPANHQRMQRVPTLDMAALEAYFRGRQEFEKRTVDSLARAIDHFDRAIQLDPGFALPYVDISLAVALWSGYANLPVEERNERLALAEGAVERALELDPLLGEAYVVLAMGQVGEGYAPFARNPANADSIETTFRRALELSPNYADGYHQFGFWLGLANRERLTEALELMQKAVELDPKSPIIRGDYGDTLFRAERYDEALAQYKESVRIEPGFAPGYRGISAVQSGVLGRLDEAVLAYRKSFSIEPNRWLTAAVLSEMYMDLGDVQQSTDWLDIALELSVDRVAPHMLLMHALRRGEFDEQTVAAARAMLAARSRDFFALLYLGDYELSRSRAANVRALYEPGFPELFSESGPELEYQNHWAAINLATAMLRTGDEATARQLLERSLAVVETLPRLGGWMGRGHGIADARVHALLGEKAAALKALREAIDAGWRLHWWYYMEFDFALESLRDDTDFQAMKRELEADMAAQLAGLRERE